MKRVSRSCLYALTIAGLLPVVACDTAPAPAPVTNTGPVAKPTEPKAEMKGPPVIPKPK